MTQGRFSYPSYRYAHHDITRSVGLIVDVVFFLRNPRGTPGSFLFLEGRGTRVMASNSSQTSFGSNFVISDISYKVLLSVLFFLPAKSETNAIRVRADTGSFEYPAKRHPAANKTSFLRHVTCPHANSPFANIRISRVPSKIYFRFSTA